MDKVRLVQKLNEAISLELQAVIQYNHNALALKGPDRRIWEDVFKEMAAHGLEHYRKFGERIVALGGVPSIEPAPATPASNAQEMLRNARDLEQRLVDAYTEALAFCEDSPAYRNLLEDQILDEVKDVEELDKYLDQIPKLQAAAPTRQQGQQTA